MKRKGKKYGIIFGAVAIALLMISSATAVTVPQTQQTQIIKEPTVNEPAVDQDPTPKNDVYVDPNIYLTRDQLPALRELLGETDDQEIRELVEQTISVIGSKGFVTGNDIKPGSGITGVYSGAISAHRCSGSAKIFLGLKFLFTFALYTAILPHTVKWSACYLDSCPHHLVIDVWVGGTHFTTPHSGRAISFTGYVYDFLEYSQTIEGGFDMEGNSPYIVIK